MEIEKLEQGKKIREQIKNLDSAIGRIRDAVDNKDTKIKGSLKVNDVDLFQGTSPLLYDCGFKGSNEVFKLMILAIIDILEKRKEVLERQFEAL